MMYVLIMIAIIAFLAYYFWPNISSMLGISKMQEFTREELSQYDGRTKKQVYLGCKGYVFDVSKSQSYRPGSTYHVFAGKDATIGLAKMSLDPVDLETSDTSRLKESEMDCLNQWFKQFKDHYKYPVVGRLVESGKSS